MESNQVLTFIISVLMHGLLLLFLTLWQPNIVVEKKKLEKWLEFEDQKTSPMMAEKTQRVEKQTRTKMTSNAAISSMEQQSQTSSVSSLRSLKELQERSFGESRTAAQLQPSSGDLFMHQAARASEAQRQQIQQYLPPELELGDMVALNTDQNLFFTFYRRMAEKIVWPWAQSITASFEKMRTEGRLGGTSKAWVTILEVLLDRNGNVVDTAPLQLAGEYDMDSAPVRAFKSAKNFPNPPIEMVEEDGYIRIRYKFVVYYRPVSQ